MKSTKSELYGFWNYDHFPYVLGAPGRLVGPEDKGHYQAQDYRQGCFLAEGYGGAAFRNPITMPLDKGLEIQAKLDDIKKNYETARDALHKAFLSQAKAVADFIKS